MLPTSLNKAHGDDRSRVDTGHCRHPEIRSAGGGGGVGGLGRGQELVCHEERVCYMMMITLAHTKSKGK